MYLRRFSRAGGKLASIFSAVISSSKRKYWTEKPCSTAQMPRPTHRCVLPDPGFGLLGRQSPGVQAATDDSFVAKHGGLSERAPAAADRLLPAQAPLVPDHLDVLVALTGRGARGRARHRG